jgi:hypothetical protein
VSHPILAHGHGPSTVFANSGLIYPPKCDRFTFESVASCETPNRRDVPTAVIPRGEGDFDLHVIRPERREMPAA